jgi:ABC-type bacteriocin/lantibiotic exporter with double-glycine peptidase domain
VGIRATSFNAMSQRIALDLRHDFFKAVVNQDVEFFENNKTGDLCKFVAETNLCGV